MEKLENGVGLIPYFEEQVLEELQYEENVPKTAFALVTGVDAAPFMEKMLDYCRDKWHNLDCDVVAVKNDFYGENVTVSGLVVGRDICKTLKETGHNKNILLPNTMIRHGENVFLDDTTIEELEKELDVKITVCEVDGCQFVNTIAAL